MAAFNTPGHIRPLLDRIAEIARDAGADAYAVGGTVRDVLLARPLHDIDLAVAHDAFGFARALASAFDGHFVALDDTNAVARVVLDGGPVRYIDVAQLQGSLEEDMLRRDFTVDALAVALGESHVVDFTGGLRDIELRFVRMNGGPRVFDADPLRILRGVRISAETGLALEAETERTIRDRGPDVLQSAPERRRDELMRIFALDDAHAGVRLLDRTGLLDALLPEVTFGRGVTQPGGFHAYDVFEHNLRCLEVMDIVTAAARPASERGALWDEVWKAFAWCESDVRAYLAGEMSEGRTRASVLKLTALLHDIAKPQTRVVDGDGAHFYGHSDMGAEIAARIMRRYRFSTREATFVTTLVREHLRPTQLAAVGEVPTRRAIYRFYKALGDAVPAVLFLSLADAASARGLTHPHTADKSEGWRQHVQYLNGLLVRSVEEEGIVSPPRLLDGHDIIRSLGVEPGPLVGKLLAALEEAQAAGEVNGRDEALVFVRTQAEIESRRPKGP